MRIAILPALLLAAGAAHAAETLERPVLEGDWVPLSKAAESITGPLRLTAGAITFEGAEPLPIEPVESGPQGTLYRVTAPRRVALRNGNTICPGPVTYLRVTPQAAGDGAFAFFETQDRPTDRDRSTCLWSVYVKQQ
ncbi:MAG TPA: hypothetical protein VD978_09340 [Azospirillum sp.]|nr:hypothetical protein [Azospirillum sp.]